MEIDATFVWTVALSLGAIVAGWNALSARRDLTQARKRDPDAPDYQALVTIAANYNFQQLLLFLALLGMSLAGFAAYVLLPPARQSVVVMLLVVSGIILTILSIAQRFFRNTEL